MNTLIIGGTSGLGREIGLLLREQGHQIFATGTGRKKEASHGFTALELKLDEKVTDLSVVQSLVDALPHIDLLVYAAGFAEAGHLDELSTAHILTMLNVGLTAPLFLIRALLEKQGELGGLIAITSTSQWTPREKEPVYAATKAALGKLADSLSLDPRIQKTLVAGPAGMDTSFWRSSGKDTAGMLKPKEVAADILALWHEKYSYRLARLLREPARVELLETRA